MVTIRVRVDVPDLREPAPWQVIAAPNHTKDYGTSSPHSWLLRVGWRIHGPFALDDVPGKHSRARRT